MINIYYPTAKAINKVYIQENRVRKKSAQNNVLSREKSGVFTNGKTKVSGTR
jgi:hypothetical protein